MRKKGFLAIRPMFCILLIVALFPLSAFSEPERVENVSERSEAEPPEIVSESNKSTFSNEGLQTAESAKEENLKSGDMSTIDRRNLNLQQSKTEMSKELRTLGNDLRFSFNRPDRLKDTKDVSKDKY